MAIPTTDDAFLATLAPQTAATPAAPTPSDAAFLATIQAVEPAPSPGASPFDVPAQFDVPLDPRTDTRPDEERRVAMLSWRVRNETRAPEEQAEILRLTAATGWNAQTVADDLPAARNMVEASRMNAAGVVRDHPALADFIGDPETGALARSDTARLSVLSSLFGESEWRPDGTIDSMTGEANGTFVETTPGLLSAWKKGRALARESHGLKGTLMSGGQVEDPSAPVSYVDEGDAGLREVPGTRAMTEAEVEATRAKVQANEQELAQLRAYGDGINEWSAWNPLKYLAKTARLLVDMGPEMAKGAVATAVGTFAGAGVGGAVAGTAYWAAEMAPETYWQLSELKKADGTPLLTEKEARDYALKAALPLGAIMGGGLSGIGLAAKTSLASRPWVATALAKALPGSVEKLLAERTVGTAIAKVAGNYTAHALQGGMMMALQSGVNAATVEVAKGQHGEDWSASDVAEAMRSGFITGLEDFAIISAWGPARLAFAERGRIHASRESARVLKDIDQNTRESKLAQRDPAKFEELLKRFGPEKTVYVELGKFGELAQEERVAARDLAARIMGDGGAAFDLATQAGAPLAIPAATYAAKVMLPGLHERLAEDIRLNLSEMTPRQTNEAILAEAKALVERAIQRGPTFEQEVNNLHAKLTQAALAAKSDSTARRFTRAEAEAWASELTETTKTAALRYDSTLQEAIERVGLPLLHLEGRNVLTGAERSVITLPGVPEAEPGVARPPAPVVYGKALTTTKSAGGGTYFFDHLQGVDGKPGAWQLRFVSKENAGKAQAEGQAPGEWYADKKWTGGREALEAIAQAHADKEPLALPKGAEPAPVEKPAPIEPDAVQAFIATQPTTAKVGTNFRALNRSFTMTESGWVAGPVGSTSSFPHVETTPSRGTREWTAQRLANAAAKAERNLNPEQPGFFDATDGKPKTQADVIAAADRTSAEYERQDRAHLAARWRAARAALKGMEPAKRAAIVKDWNRGIYPSDPAYLLDLIRHFDAKQAEAAKPAPAPEPAPVQAAIITEPAPVAARAEARVVTPQFPKGEAATYRVVEADAVVASHNTGFVPDPRYPANVQEREYHRDPAEQGKVVAGAQALDPGIVLSDVPEAVSGPPIVTSGSKSLVLGGNGRSLMMKTAFRDPEKAAAYRAALLAKAGSLGLDVKAIEGMKAPMLVRELKGLTSESPPADLAAAVVRYNDSMTQVMPTRVKAISQARLMSEDTVSSIGNLLARGDRTIREVVAQDPSVLIARLEADGLITDQNRSSWVQGQGELTEDGKARIEGMFLGRVIGTGDRLSATSAGLLGKVERIAPHLIRVAGTAPEFNEIPTFQAALDLLNDMAARDLNFTERLGQTGMFGTETAVPADVVAMARLIHGSKPKALADHFHVWAEKATPSVFNVRPSRESARAALAISNELGDLDPGIQKSLLANMKAELGISAQPKRAALESKPVKVVPPGELELEAPGAALKSELAQASLVGAVVKEEDGFVTIRNPESRLWMMATVKPEERMLETSVVGMDGGGAYGSSRYKAAVADEKGKGYSSSYYLKVIAEAKGRGFGLMSDKKRTQATEDMYARLINDLGIPFEKRTNEQAETRYYLDADKVAAIDVQAKWEQLQAQTVAKHGALKQDNRGSLRFQMDPTGRPIDFDIRALAGDKSTLAHETGHFLSWSLHEMASAANAPESVKADYASLMRYAGWADGAQRLAETLELAGLAKKATRTPEEEARVKELASREERISHAWEQYLAEGKAPSAELTKTFTRFRRWMRELYDGIEGIDTQYRTHYGQPLDLSNEVRGVFGRLLAVDSEVDRLRAAEAGPDLGALLHMTPDQRAGLEALREQKYADARERLDIATTWAGGRAASGVLATEKARMKVEAKATVNARPEQVAHALLAEGVLYDSDTGRTVPLPDSMRDSQGRPLKLQAKTVADVLGPKAAADLVKRGLAVEKGGISANDLASVLPFENGEALVRALAFMQPRERAVEIETDRMFEAAFGTELTKHADALSAHGNDAIHSPAAILEALHIRDALARELGRPPEGNGSLSVKLLNANVRRLIEGTRVAEVSPKHFLDAERTGAKRSYDLMAQAARARDIGQNTKADQLYNQALHEWDAVVLSKLLWSQATKTLKELTTAEKKMKQAATLPWAKGLGLTDIVYADANISMLAAAGFAKGEVNPAILDQALSAMERDQGAVERNPETGRLDAALWDSQAVRELLAKPHAWSTMTTAEALNLRDAVTNLKATANGQRKLDVAGKKMERAALLDAIAASTERLDRTNLSHDPAAPSLGSRAAAKAKHILMTVDANLTEIEKVVERLAGNDRDHPVWQAIMGEYLKARDFEAKLTLEFKERIEKLWGSLPEGTTKHLNDVAAGAREALPLKDTGGIFNSKAPITRGYLMMMALNLGNEGNQQRLLDGYGWSAANVHDTLAKHLTAEDWRWVQGVWDTLTPLYPHIERVHIEDTGLRPPQVKARAFKVRTADGQELELAGGYFPARYDERIPSNSKAGEKQADTATNSLLAPVGKPVKTVTSASQTRAVRYNGLIKLDNFGIVPAHVTAVVHDVAFRRYVKQVNGLILDPRFETLVKGRLGPEVAALFPDYIKAVANGGRDGMAGPMGLLNAGMSWAKNRTTLMAVGFNIAIPLADYTNPLLAMATEGPAYAKHLALVTGQLAGNWKELRQFALDNSGEVRARALHGNSMGLDVEKMVGNGWGHQVEHAAYWMMEHSDRATTTPMWLARFNERMESAAAAGVEPGKAHELAVRDADALLRHYLPSTDQALKSAWFRDKGVLGHLTFLYGFANKVYGMNRQTVLHLHDAWAEPGATAASKAKAIGAFMWVLTAQAAVLGIPGDFLSGRGPPKKDDDAKGVAKWAAKRMASTLAYQLPFGSWMDGQGGRGGAPAVQSLQRLKSQAVQGIQGKLGPGEATAVLGSLLVLRGAGLNQATKTGRYLDGDMSRDLRAGHLGSVGSGLTFGQKATAETDTLLNLGGNF